MLSISVPSLTNKQRKSRAKTLKRYDSYLQIARQNPSYAFKRLIQILRELAHDKFKEQMNYIRLHHLSESHEYKYLDLLQHFLDLLSMAHLHFIFSEKEFLRIKAAIADRNLCFPFSNPEISFEQWSKSILLIREDSIDIAQLPNKMWRIKVVGMEVYHQEDIDFCARSTNGMQIAWVDEATFKGFKRINKPLIAKWKIEMHEFFSGVSGYIGGKYKVPRWIIGQIAGLPQYQDYYF